MEYTDEVFIRAMNKHKAEQQGDIYSGVFIREEIFEFERLCFPKNSLICL